MRMQSQWVITMGGVAGLNYQSLQILIKMYGVKDEKQAFEDVQIMEYAALPILNKKD